MIAELVRTVLVNLLAAALAIAGLAFLFSPSPWKAA